MSYIMGVGVAHFNGFFFDQKNLFLILVQG